MNIKFEVPRKVILNANQSLHYHAKGNRVKKLREMSYEITKNLGVHFQYFTIDILVYPPTRRRLDPPNLYPTVKALVDGMTDSHMWDDDDYKHLKRMSFGYGGLSGTKDLFIIEMNIQEVTENAGSKRHD